MFTMGGVHTSYGLSPPAMMLSDNFKDNTKAASRSLPNIILYLNLVESST